MICVLEWKHGDAVMATGGSASLPAVDDGKILEAKLVLTPSQLLPNWW